MKGPASNRTSHAACPACPACPALLSRCLLGAADRTRNALRADGRLRYSRAARGFAAGGLLPGEDRIGSRDDTATFVYPSCDIRQAHLFPGARSSAGQSSCLLSSGSRVRILPGALVRGLSGPSPTRAGSQKGSQSECTGSHDVRHNGASRAGRGLDLLGRVQEPVRRRREPGIQPCWDAYPQESHWADQDGGPGQAPGPA